MLLTQSYSFSTQRETPSSSQWEQGSVSDISIRRVTIRQLLKANPIDPHSKRFQINGVEVKKIMLVANVRDEHATSTGKTYDFDDGTGRIKGNSWKINPDFTFEQFAYARVVGELDQFNGFYTLKLFSVQPVFDPYEIYFHILKAIEETVEFERGPPPREFLRGDHTNHLTQNQEMDDISQALQDVSISTDTMKSVSQVNKRRPRSRLERHLLSLVFRFTGDDDDDDEAECANLENIIEELKATHPNISARDIANAVESLLTEGYITSVDDYHYIPGPRFRSGI